MQFNQSSRKMKNYFSLQLTPLIALLIVFDGAIHYLKIELTLTRRHKIKVFFQTSERIYYKIYLIFRMTLIVILHL